MNYLQAFLADQKPVAKNRNVWVEQPTEPTEPGFVGSVGSLTHTYPENEAAENSGNVWVEPPTKPTEPLAPEDQEALEQILAWPPDTAYFSLSEVIESGRQWNASVLARPSKREAP